ncbi:MAG: cysteine-rich CWC family protein [Steroidobacteraceae bacterium]
MSLEPGRCPRCHQPNRCTVAAQAGADAHCWCMDQPCLDPANPAVAAALPEGRGTACLCQACVQQLAALGQAR